MTYKQTATDIWIKENGLNGRTFHTARLEVVRAQQAAKLLLTQYTIKLDKEQLATLHDFQRAAANSKKIDKISTAQCNKVLNICKAYNRRLFKLNRILNG